MKIYTKTGDSGNTALFGGTRVPKCHFRIEAYGTVDELNSYMGLIASFEVNEKRKNLLHQIQETLFNIGATLAADPESKNVKIPKFKTEEITILEKDIDEMENSLPALKTFILPGGNTEISFCHIARTVCRRAERMVVGLKEKNQQIPEAVIIYLNRLSDFLFVLARKIAQDMNVDEITWKGL